MQGSQSTLQSCNKITSAFFFFPGASRTDALQHLRFCDPNWRNFGVVELISLPMPAIRMLAVASFEITCKLALQVRGDV
jgi:hypothetical protein